MVNPPTPQPGRPVSQSEGRAAAGLERQIDLCDLHACVRWELSGVLMRHSTPMLIVAVVLV